MSYQAVIGAALSVAMVLGTYVPAAQAACSASSSGTTYTATSGTLMSDTDGAGNASYANNEDCRWYIECPRGTVSISGTLETELDVDVLRIYPGRSASTTDSGAIFIRSGNSQVYSRVTTQSTVTIYFSTDGTATRGGFHLWYVCIESVGGTSTPAPSTPHCTSSTANTVYSDATGTIQSDIDGYGVNNYANNQACLWYVGCPNGSLFNIVNLDLRTQACCDEVTVFPGFANATQSTDGSILSRSGQWVALSQATQSNVVTIRFTTDRSETSNGFTLQWACVHSTPSPFRTCSSDGPFDLKADSGTIRSDTDGTGPTQYHDNERCTWSVTCSQGTIAVMSSLSMQVEPCCDYVALQDSFGRELARYRAGFFTPISTGVNSMRLYFYSDSSVTDDGFTLQYECVPPSVANGYTQLESSSSLGTGTVAGIVVGSVVGFIILVVIVIIVGYFLCCRRSPSQSQHQEHDPSDQGAPESQEMQPVYSNPIHIVPVHVGHVEGQPQPYGYNPQPYPELPNHVPGPRSTLKSASDEG